MNEETTQTPIEENLNETHKEPEVQIQAPTLSPKTIGQLLKEKRLEKGLNLKNDFSAD